MIKAIGWYSKTDSVIKIVRYQVMGASLPATLQVTRYLDVVFYLADSEFFFVNLGLCRYVCIICKLVFSTYRATITEYWNSLTRMPSYPQHPHGSGHWWTEKGVFAY